jgi:hypothetical protein
VVILGEIVQTKIELWFVVEPCNLAVALPKLNVVAVDKQLRLFHGLIVIDADQRNRFAKMTVMTDKICVIFRHVATPNGSGGSITELIVIECCRGLGGDAFSLASAGMTCPSGTGHSSSFLTVFVAFELLRRM